MGAALVFLPKCINSPTKNSTICNFGLQQWGTFKDKKNNVNNKISITFRQHEICKTILPFGGLDENQSC